MEMILEGVVFAGYLVLTVVTSLIMRDISPHTGVYNKLCK